MATVLKAVRRLSATEGRTPQRLDDDLTQAFQ
jgi:hypothetical protein